MDHETFAAAYRSQRAELTEHHIYARLASRSSGSNAKVLATIAADELRHHRFWQGMTRQEAAPHRLTIWWYLLLARAFGLVFAIKLMERGEGHAQTSYEQLKRLRGVPKMIMDEQRHEAALAALLRDERLEYAGSIVLGLNDALVELTGVLAGLTLALSNATVVALAGFITGFAASLSMAASGYLSSKEEADQNREKSPVKAALYTGVTYLLTVLLLIAPYLLFHNLYVALAVTLGLAVVIIAAYTFYITVAKELRFWPRFVEMAVISLIVAALSFGVGWLAKTVLGV
jgi:VIT1/CCC1 family predicted Fe2+/Mn2+ transporter